MDRKDNKGVLNHLKLKREIMKNIRARQLKYLSHVKTRNTIMKAILERKVEGKRVRGGQQYRLVGKVIKKKVQPCLGRGHQTMTSHCCFFQHTQHKHEIVSNYFPWYIMCYFYYNIVPITLSVEVCCSAYKHLEEDCVFRQRRPLCFKVQFYDKHEVNNQY